MVCVKLIRKCPISILLIILKYKNEIEITKKSKKYLDIIKTIEYDYNTSIDDTNFTNILIFRDDMCRRFLKCSCNYYICGLFIQLLPKNYTIQWYLCNSYCMI